MKILAFSCGISHTGYVLPSSSCVRVTVAVQKQLGDGPPLPGCSAGRKGPSEANHTSWHVRVFWFLPSL